MIYDGLIVPEENPPTVLEIKRALITYDKVTVIDPSDRDLIPSTSFLAASLPVPIPVAINTGDVRPMGKAIGYDDRYQKVLEAFRPAIQGGLLEVVATYNKEESDRGAIGGVNMGGYPLNPRFVFWCYRSMASDQPFLSAAIPKDDSDLETRIELSPDLCLEGVGDRSLHGLSALPELDRDMEDGYRNAATQVARARIATFIKFAGYCENKNLAPIYNNETYGRLFSRLMNNASDVLLSVADSEEALRISRILQLCHEEYLEDSVLDNMSISEVLKLRSTAWGKQAEAREGLFDSIHSIALDVQDDAKFESAAKKLISEYRKKSQSLEAQRAALRFRVKCDMGIGVLGGGVAVNGLLSQIQSPFPMALTLAAGGMWALEKAKDYVPEYKNYRAAQNEIAGGAGFGLSRFYSRLQGS